MLHLLTSS